jgi:hypothetical protein
LFLNNFYFKNDLQPINVDQTFMYIQNDLDSIQSIATIQETISNNNFKFYLKLLAVMLNNDENLWRLFKGRLYTRLHDKRIHELNLNAIINVSYLFLILIKTIAKPVEAVRCRTILKFTNLLFLLQRHKI